MKAVTFRAAVREDSRTIAELYSISSDGVAGYIWTQMAEAGEDILDVGRRRYERTNTPFSYLSCTLAELDGKTAGMMVAFPMHLEPNESEEEDPVLAPYSKLEEDASLYICGVALFEGLRGRSIGSQFMQMAEEIAREEQLDKLSLIVFEQNTDAKRLYERLGYKVKAREKVYPHPLIHYTSDALLMVKVL